MLRIRIDEIAGCGVVYSGRITRGGGGGLISLTSVDSGKGCWGFSLVFSVCMFGGDEVEC